MGSPFLPRVSRERAPNYEGLGTGWPAMARIVREIDEQKIQNYKDDIDTILVFAGLFSGVMTAFLVESYHNLSPDPTQMMILLMRQLTTQTHSYTINGGFLNSTAPPLPDAPPPAFTPTVNAIRVNVLWFASLTLSLMSASFSILVKQWLQEYLAGEYTSPQARIRIRHFRYPGLDDWKVFEIAAALPLFLQLSLALFFIGLCFFTADIHSTVGHTTLPLVAAWGFLFIIVSLAPALSPRCPYKTRLLKSVVKDMRKIVLQLVLWVKSMSYRDLSPFTEVVGGLWSYQLLAYDEEDAVTTDKNDVDIFISVDSIQSDEVLLQAMWHALQQTEPNPADAFTFILNIISHRVPQRVAVAPDAVLDLKRVPKPTVTAIMDMTAETVRDVLNRQPHSVAATDVTEWQAWLRSCVYIVLAETDAPVSHAVKEILAPLLADKIWYRALFDTIKSCLPDPDAFPALLDRLSPALALADRATTLDMLAYLMQCYFCDKDDVAHSHNTAVDILDAHPDLSPRHREAVTKFIFPLMTKDLDLADYPKWAFAERRLILHLYSYAGDRRTEIVEFVRLLLTTWANISLIISVAVGMHIDTPKSLRDNAQAVFVDAAVTCTSDVIPNVLKNLVWYAERYAKRAAVLKEDESTKSYTMDPLLGCLVFMRILKALRDMGLSLDEYSTSIRDFWSGIDEGLQALAGSRDLWKENYPASAQGCLEVVNELDCDVPLPSDGKDEKTFIAWTKAFPADKSLFSDQLIKNISLFLPPEANQDTMCVYRMRRLQILEKQDMDVPSSEDSNGIARSRTDSHSSEQTLQMASSSGEAQKASLSVAEGSSAAAEKDTTGFDADSRRPEPNTPIEETEMAAAVGVKERESSNDAATVADISVNPDHWLTPLSPASNSLSSDHGTVVTPSSRSDDS